MRTGVLVCSQLTRTKTKLQIKYFLTFTKPDFETFPPCPSGRTVSEFGFEKRNALPFQRISGQCELCKDLLRRRYRLLLSV